MVFKLLNSDLKLVAQEVHGRKYFIKTGKPSFGCFASIVKALKKIFNMAKSFPNPGQLSHLELDENFHW